MFSGIQNSGRALAFVALLTATSVASAATLPPGSTLFPVPAGPGPTGALTTVAGGVPMLFVTSTYSGTLTTTVQSNDSSNPFGLSALTFSFLLTSNASSVNVIERLTSNGWTGFQTDASYATPSLGIIPTYADRQTPDVVGFGFLPAPIGPGTLTPGSTSRLLVVHTDATLFQPSFASVIDGTVTSVPSFSPLIPEPGTMGLLLAGALMLGRRRAHA